MLNIKMSRTVFNPNLTQYKLFPRIHTKPLPERTDYDTLVDADDERFIFGEKEVVKEEEHIKKLRQDLIGIKQVLSI